VINFNTGYYKKGHLILRRRKIVRRYLRSWFWLDLIATFPYGWFIAATTDITLDDIEMSGQQTKGWTMPASLYFLRLMKIIRFLRILRLIRMFKLRGLVQRFEEYFFSDKFTMVTDLLKLVAFVLFVVHWTGCIFFFI
jgi:hyperpolarization activated cyclic nucleotide-gated potassium channel 2